MKSLLSKHASFFNNFNCVKCLTSCQEIEFLEKPRLIPPDYDLHSFSTRYVS